MTHRHFDQCTFIFLLLVEDRSIVLVLILFVSTHSICVCKVFRPLSVISFSLFSAFIFWSLFLNCSSIQVYFFLKAILWIYYDNNNIYLNLKCTTSFHIGIRYFWMLSLKHSLRFWIVQSQVWLYSRTKYNCRTSIKNHIDIRDAKMNKWIGEWR